MHAVRAPVELARSPSPPAISPSTPSFVRIASREEFGDRIEVGRVDVLGVAVHQRRDRVMALPGACAHVPDSNLRARGMTPNFLRSRRTSRMRSTRPSASSSTTAPRSAGARGTLPVEPRVCQPMGIVHGGVYAAIAESLASMARRERVLAERQGAARDGEQHELSSAGERGLGARRGAWRSTGAGRAGSGTSRCATTRAGSARRRGSRSRCATKVPVTISDRRQGQGRVLLVHRDHRSGRAPRVQRVAPARPHARAVSAARDRLRTTLGVDARVPSALAT